MAAQHDDLVDWYIGYIEANWCALAGGILLLVADLAVHALGVA